jgi:hypothetical protein
MPSPRSRSSSLWSRRRHTKKQKTRESVTPSICVHPSPNVLLFCARIFKKYAQFSTHRSPKLQLASFRKMHRAHQPNHPCENLGSMHKTAEGPPLAAGRAHCGAGVATQKNQKTRESVTPSICVHPRSFAARYFVLLRSFPKTMHKMHNPPPREHSAKAPQPQQTRTLIKNWLRFAKPPYGRIATEFFAQSTVTVVPSAKVVRSFVRALSRNS